MQAGVARGPRPGGGRAGGNGLECALVLYPAGYL